MKAKKINKKDLPIYLFHQGTNYQSYDFLGAHFGRKGGKYGVYFRVWANNAEKVSVVGEFNGWNINLNPMTKISSQGVFETFIEGLKEYDSYKYAITSKGKTVLKADPYAFHGEHDGGHCSKVYKIDGYKWKDKDYLENKKAPYSAPMNVYEVHLASFMRKENGDYYTYKELAKTLVPYVKDMGYTHVEFMPISEYPFDGSWGYQVTGYYSATSRFGTPKDLMYLIDCFHKNGIGVIIDWVPAHFPKDEFGLIDFDGDATYENQGWDRKENKGWGTRVFDWGRNEVQSFLVSNAVYWFDKFHVDGLRIDAVASMLYLDYDKEEGEWIPNQYGENINLEAVAFFKKLNSVVFNKFNNIIMAAEESTSFSFVTKPVDVGGLGFNYKWNMGWMNDVLSYVKEDPYFRSYHHNKLTFSMCYSFSENYILPISHDEVVHGKKSLLDRMPGEYEDKFAGNRAFLMYMMAHPGKKLTFMGTEFGQFKEWNYKEGLEFFLLDYEKHRKLKTFYKKVNHFYKENSPLFEIEDSWDGFNWISADEKENNVISFIRRDKLGKEIIVIINFSGKDYDNYYLGVDKGEYKLVLNSDQVTFGGNGKIKKTIYKTVKKVSHGKKNSIKIKLPKLTALYFEKSKGEKVW